VVRNVSMVVLEVSPPSPSSLEALERHRALDGDARSVDALCGLVGMLSSFGSSDSDMPHTLGHPEVLRTALRYTVTARFTCPGCDPWAIGTSRACTATVMARVALRFEARKLVEATHRSLRTLGPSSARGPSGYGVSWQRPWKAWRSARMLCSGDGNLALCLRGEHLLHA
jgi:hypothetical protein